MRGEERVVMDGWMDVSELNRYKSKRSKCSDQLVTITYNL